jgi:hypothetical protein
LNKELLNASLANIDYRYCIKTEHSIENE